eukprot:g10413.t1
MAEDAQVSGAAGAGDTNAPALASKTLGGVDIDLLEPLERAVGAGDADATAALLPVGATVSPDAIAAEDRPLRRNVLHWAALGGNPDVVMRVLRAVVASHVDEVGEGECIAEFAFVSHHTTADALKVTSLSEGGGPDGRTPLHLAVEGGHVAVADVLLAHGASIFAQDGHGQTPLTLSFDKNNDEMALGLVRQCLRFCTLPPPAKEVMLQLAAWRGCLPVVKLLLREGVSTSASDVTAETPLMAAALSCRNTGKVIKRLLAAGADVDESDSENQTALFFAVKYSDHHPGRAIRALMAGGADPHLPGARGFSAVQQAALDNNVGALFVFFDLGVDPDTRHRLDHEEYGGASLLDLAARTLSVGAVKVLLSAGANDGIAATAREPLSTCGGQRPPKTTVPADVVGLWADRVTPALPKAKRDKRSAAILSLLARAKFFRKDWLSVLRARCDVGAETSLTGVGSSGEGPSKAQPKATPGARSSSSAATAMDGDCASSGDGVVGEDNSVWCGACAWLAMVPDEDIFRNVVDWL